MSEGTHARPAAGRVRAWVWALGLAGLAPFFGAAFILWLTAASAGALPALAFASLVLYAAVIVSFLGGARWGQALGGGGDGPSAHVLVMAILPSLAGWAGALAALFPALAVFGDGSATESAAPHAGLAPGIALGVPLLVAAYLGMLWWDLVGERSGVWPSGYGRLRIVLTFGAILALLSVVWRLASLTPGA